MSKSQSFYNKKDTNLLKGRNTEIFITSRPREHMTNAHSPVLDFGKALSAKNSVKCFGWVFDLDQNFSIQFNDCKVMGYTFFK